MIIDINQLNQDINELKQYLAKETSVITPSKNNRPRS